MENKYIFMVSISEKTSVACLIGEACTEQEVVPTIELFDKVIETRTELNDVSFFQTNIPYGTDDPKLDASATKVYETLCTAGLTYVIRDMSDIDHAAKNHPHYFKPLSLRNLVVEEDQPVLPMTILGAPRKRGAVCMQHVNIIWDDFEPNFMPAVMEQYTRIKESLTLRRITSVGSKDYIGWTFLDDRPHEDFDVAILRWLDKCYCIANEAITV